MKKMMMMIYMIIQRTPMKHMMRREVYMYMCVEGRKALYIFVDRPFLIHYNEAANRKANV